MEATLDENGMTWLNMPKVHLQVHVIDDVQSIGCLEYLKLPPLDRFNVRRKHASWTASHQQSWDLVETVGV